MPISVNHQQATTILTKAFNSECILDNSISCEITTILLGSHKTFKYVLITALLAKATNNDINTLSLQAGAPLKGAYDARTLCHGVVVPFERDYLNTALGASNEPFLNKPARFTHLDRTNPVRRGNDKALLFTLIDALQAIHSSSDAFQYLVCALTLLKKIGTSKQEMIEESVAYNPTLVEIYDFCIRFLEQPFEGSSLAIIVGTLERLYYRQYSLDYLVIAHKVNQSGASSKEIGDIDIYLDRKFDHAIEVKDKHFTKYDLEHSVNKVKIEGGSKSHFIYGPNATFNADDVSDEVLKNQSEGFLVLVQDFFHYARTVLFRTNLESTQEFTSTLKEIATEMNSAKEMYNWISDLFSDMAWI